MANYPQELLLYLYRARNKITQLSIPTHAQLQCHRLKSIKNHLKTPTCFGLWPSSGSYNVLAKIRSSTALARTRTLGRSSSTTRYKIYDMLPHHHA